MCNPGCSTLYQISSKISDIDKKQAKTNHETPSLADCTTPMHVKQLKQLMYFLHYNHITSVIKLYNNYHYKDIKYISKVGIFYFIW